MNLDYDTEVLRIARALSEIAHTLEGVDFASERVRRALVLAREVVPYAQCALLELSAGGELELICIPEVADADRELLRARLASVLTALSDADGSLEPGDPTGHLMLPVMGLDRVIGVVRVTPIAAVPYQARHVRLLSVVAAQIGAYLAMMRLHEEQRRVAVDLSAASEFQQRLVGIVSHDLRNPLSVITTVAATLLPGAEDQRQARALDRALRSAQRATRIIGDLVDVTQARVRGELSIIRCNADLRELISDVIEDTRATHPKRTLVLDDRVGGALVGSWDADRIAQLAINLLGNALQYGAPDRPITVALAADGGDAVLSVHNHGAAIPGDFLPLLFDPFRRGARQRTRGLGLGLFIVDQIARAHGGVTSVRSEAEHGTTFTVRLPRDGAAAQSTTTSLIGSTPSPAG